MPASRVCYLNSISLPLTLCQYQTTSLASYESGENRALAQAKLPHEFLHVVIQGEPGDLAISDLELLFEIHVHLITISGDCSIGCHHLSGEGTMPSDRQGYIVTINVGIQYVGPGIRKRRNPAFGIFYSFSENVMD